jgi:hypothetical protein
VREHASEARETKRERKARERRRAFIVSPLLS